MKKRLIAKAQKLTPKFEEKVKSLSNALIITPEDDNILLKKGILYCVFDLESKNDFDSLLITKLFTDILNHSYFESESTSPIQALENSVVDLRDKIQKLPQSESDKNIKFNIILAALWGNVLYIVKLGDGHNYLMRAGSLKTINAATEGNFSVSSGVIKDGDVIIFSSASFDKNLPAEKLLNLATPISPFDLDNKASSMVLKFKVDTTFTQNEIVTFNDSSNNKTVKNLGSNKKQFNSTKDVKSKDIKLKTPKKLNYKELLLFLVPLVGLLIALSIFLSYRNSLRQELLLDSDDSIAAEVVEDLTGAQIVDNGDNLAAFTQAVVLEATPFYDITLADEAANPTELTVLDNFVVVTDSASGNIFTSSWETPKFTALETTFSEISEIGYFENDLYFVDSEGFKVYSVSDDEVLEQYSLDNDYSTALNYSTYLDFIYAISEDSIIKFEKSTTGLVGEAWATSQDLLEAIDIAIDGSIYVLNSDATVSSYTSGVADDFILDTLEVPLQTPTKLVTSVEMDYLYISDVANNRLVVFDKNGELVKQFIHQDNEEWNDITDFSISQDETTAFLLVGTRVYEIDLTLDPTVSEDSPESEE